MRNAMILLGLWVGIILAAYSIVYVDGGAPASGLSPIPIETYTDPSGRFDLVVPIGWRTGEEGGALHLTGPMEEVEGWVVYVDDMAAFRAIETAWEKVDPCFERAYDSSYEMSPVGPEIRRVRVIYSASQRVLAYGIAHVVRGGTVVLLVRGEAATCRGRAADELEWLEETLNVHGDLL